MNATITGTIVSATPVKQVSETFRTRTFILKQLENFNGNTYENFIEFQLTNNNCDLINTVNPGQEVTVTYNPKGRMWTNPNTGVEICITNLNAWKIQPAQAQQTGGQWGNQPAQAQQTESWGAQTIQQPAPAWGGSTQSAQAPEPQENDELPF